MTKLILVRHGESMGNKLEIFTGHTNIELTERGQKQAEALSDYLADYNIDKIYSSDLIRAYNTALPTAKKKGIDIIASKNLREIYGGKWEKMNFADIIKAYPDEYGVWLNDIGKARCSGGESVVELKDRIAAEIHKILEKNEGKTVMVVSHATPIRTLFSTWNGTPVENLKDVSWVANSSVSVAEYEDINALPKITLYGECDFLGEFKTSLPVNV